MEQHLLQARLTLTWWLEGETGMGGQGRTEVGRRRHRSGPPGLPDPAVPSLFSLGREHPPHCCHATKSDQITELSWPISSFRGSEILATSLMFLGKKQRRRRWGSGLEPGHPLGSDPLQTLPQAGENQHQQILPEGGRAGQSQ